MQPEQQQRIMGYFIEEAKDHLNTIEQGLLNLQGMMADPELVNEVFRAAHSVKGGAAMLSLHSIQKTAHRLEDYFKILKEAPAIKPDRKLETLLLKVFDVLKEHLEQLQMPAGLDEETAQASLKELEPVFSEVEQHLTQLERQATSVPSDDRTVIQAEAAVQDNALLLIFQNDVPAQLREMLQTFRQAETTLNARERLQEICLGLQGLGDAFGLVQWSQLIETANRAIANPENAYRELAPLVITEIKQAQGLVLAGRAKEIAPSEQLKAMAPVQFATEEMDLELADFFAIANSDSSDELDFSGLDFAATDSVEDSSLDSLFELPESDALSLDSGEMSLDGMFDSLEMEEVPAAIENRKGPDMGMDELNSLADLFESDVPELGDTWEQEEILDSSMLSSSLEDAQEAEDFANFLSAPSESNVTQTGDLADLFGNDLLEELNTTDSASLETVDDFELPDFSEDVTEFGTVPGVPAESTSPVEGNGAALDLGFDDLDLMTEGVSDFEEDESSLDNLGELFAGLDDTDLGLSASGQADELDQVDSFDPTELDGMFEIGASEDLGLDALELNDVLDDPIESSQPSSTNEIAADPWDSLELEAESIDSALFDQSEVQNGAAKNADELKLDDIASEDLELSSLGLDSSEDDVLDALFSGDLTDEASIGDLFFDTDESESDNLELDQLLSEPLLEVTATSDLNSLNLDEEADFSLNGFSTLNADEQEVLDFEGTASEESLHETADPFGDLLNFSTSESVEDQVHSVNGSSSSTEDSLADLLDFSDEATINIELDNTSTEGLSFDTEDSLADLLEFSPSESSIDLEDALLGLSSESAIGLEKDSTLSEELSFDTEDSLADLLDFSSTESYEDDLLGLSSEPAIDLETNNISSEELSFDTEDSLADLLNFSSTESYEDDLLGLSSEPAIDLETNNISSEELSFDTEDSLADSLDFSSTESSGLEDVSLQTENELLDLDSLIGDEVSAQALSLNQGLDDLQDEFDLSLVEPATEVKADGEFDLGFVESSTSSEDDFSDLSLELFGADTPTQENSISYQDEFNLDGITGDASDDTSLDDLDSLLGDQQDVASEPSNDDSLLNLGMGAAAIATLGAGFAAVQSNDELDNLDDFLNASEPSNDHETTNLDDLDSLLNEAPSHEAVIDNFDDLESLLADAPEATPQNNIAATNEADAEFGDLEKMLEESDMTMGSAAKSRAAAPQGRRSTRAAKGFSEQTMRVPIKHLDNLSNLVGELVVNRNSLEQDQERLRQSLDNLLYQVQQLSDVGQRMQDLYERSLLESSLLASRQNRSVPFGGSERNSGNGNSIGVEYDPLEMDRFTGFHSLSQEMIELIVRVRESSSDIEFIVDETDQVTRMFRQVTTQLQEGLTRSRMVPFAQTADRLPRAVRDIAMKCGKQAELVIEGRDTLIDKMILEHLYDPMTHLVNNAITHGIEDPEVRRAAGKPPTGKITIRAFHQGNQTVISVSDDGAGVDVERVRSKAIEKGLITAAEAKSASRLDIYDLLFHPGFSTKDQADDFSGRGVGMDVVRTSLSEIRGTISTDSTQNKGTMFTIRLPLTLSISKALCCISDRARIAFPMDGVEDMLDIPKERLQTDAEGKPCITWRDAVLPVRPLRELLNYNRHLSRGTVYGGNQEDDMVSIVILRSAGNYLALQVDQVLGEQEIVIKQLEGPVPKPIGVAGATVLGDGRIMPIADVLELIDLSVGRIRRDVGSMWETGTAQPVVEVVAAKTEPMVLIVDDSITVRELLSMTFNKVGYRVEQARDGQEAWEKLRSGLPCDIVFCDIEMPRMDGLELLSRIQKDPNLSNLPIAMLTSRGADRHRQMAASLGASGYFTKPYLEEALLDAAQRMLKGEILISSNSSGNS
ncbi:response regulator [Leptolyngbya sp. AN03gr2]|uniref:hybrid sensor histidine kinase/response regulator n=1 Tax=unclassified Leptolyngbya TaxID=2650499 RepID=UPI003D31FB77